MLGDTRDRVRNIKMIRRSEHVGYTQQRHDEQQLSFSFFHIAKIIR